MYLADRMEKRGETSTDKKLERIELVEKERKGVDSLGWHFSPLGVLPSGEEG